MMKKLLIVVCALALAASCSTTSRVAMEHLVIDADGSQDVVTFKPSAKAGIGGDIADAKQDMSLKISTPDGYSYDLMSGQNVTGLSNKAQVEMVSGIVQGMMQALPAILPSLVEAYTGMPTNPPKPGILEQIDWAALAELIRAWKESGGFGILPLTPTP